MATLDRETKPQIHHDIVLGEGYYGATVFQGAWRGKSVAVKRVHLIDVDDSKSQREDAVLELNHPNVVKLFHAENDDKFRSMNISKPSYETTYDQPLDIYGFIRIH